MVDVMKVAAVVVLALAAVLALVAGHAPDNTSATLPDNVTVKLYRGYGLADQTIYIVGKHNGRLYLFGSFGYNPPGKPGYIRSEPVDVTGVIVEVDDVAIGYFDGIVSIDSSLINPNLFYIEPGAEVVFY